jgi:hypothetical protein
LSDPRSWSSILKRADEAVRSDPAAGFTTLVGLCISRSAVVGASSGDSAALLVLGRVDKSWEVYVEPVTATVP